MDIETAREKIVSHRKKEENNKQKELLEKEQKKEALIQSIGELEPRIMRIIEIGNLCLDNNINIEEFETEAIHHRLGFYRFKSCIGYNFIGFRNGGANGNQDFITDGFETVHIWFNSQEPIAEYNIDKDDFIYHCEKFLKNFDEFENKFYEFINNL